MSFTYGLYRTVQTVSPSSGDTVVIDPSSSDIRTLLTPSGTLATLTLQFPNENDSILGQSVDVWSSHEITDLTCSANTIVNGLPVAITIDNPPNTILANSRIAFMKVGTLHWTGTQ